MSRMSIGDLLHLLRYLPFPLCGVSVSPLLTWSRGILPPPVVVSCMYAGGFGPRPGEDSLEGHLSRGVCLSSPPRDSGHALPLLLVSVVLLSLSLSHSRSLRVSFTVHGSYPSYKINKEDVKNLTESNFDIIDLNSFNFTIIRSAMSIRSLRPLCRNCHKVFLKPSSVSCCPKYLFLQ